MTMSNIVFHLLHPTHEDLITAVFDLIFVYSGLMNVRQLYRDKIVKGFDWRNMCLYMLWNIWSSVVIYPNANIYVANIVNIFYFMTQVVWLIMLFYYKGKRYGREVV